MKEDSLSMSSPHKKSLDSPRTDQYLVKLEREKEEIKKEKENILKMVENEKERAEQIKLEMSEKLNRLQHELIVGGEALSKAEKEKENQK